ncbi:regulator of amino acid metabolism, contains ACT domain protein [Methanomicrobiaceae archaeon CYW5]|uniref:regulator of amino acid metabolism, contains ACT domain protein n=1 Tax=Methanovulcanius yangii TaxID=1789227 RepID=UPI0029C9F4E6|nr:regulator of amino acid metabolism, contains ACT domain protein [Methanovulcanius yangii]MBT8507771.1 regulator of amino acid metabolism, contains ACT domain protein [Methanovulcanius yangii]
MWATILEQFSDSPSQSQVVRFLLENGLGINERGRVTINGIEIPATHLSKAIGTDRRVVDATVKRILSMEKFAEIFLNMQATPDLSRVAESLGLTVITVLPKDAGQKGIVGAAVAVLTGHDIGIRQIFVTDPHLSEDPKLVIIVEDPLPPEVFKELRDLSQVRKLIL